MSGEARAAEYLKLAQLKEQGPWHYTFVKGIGYTDFHDVDRKAYFSIGDLDKWQPANES